MKIFVTGASGFIGAHLVQTLLSRQHEVVCLVRDPNKAGKLAETGARLVAGDVTDRSSLPAAMKGSGAVFHLAGWYAFGKLDKARMQAINVNGARNTLEVAADLGVPRILHTSTVGVFGNTGGKVVDEAFRAERTTLGSEYERTKWSAHYEVAVPLQEKGAPVIILQPGGVTGRGDTSPHVQTIDLFLQRTPMMFGANAGLTWAHVDDIAEGQVLALEKGQTGQSYILAGEPVTYRQTFEILERISGLPAAKLWAPGWAASGMSAFVALLESAGLRLPFSAEALATLDDYTFWGSADKAKRELGWTPRPLEAVLAEILKDRQSRLA